MTKADAYKYLVDFQGSSTTIISSDKTGMAFYTSNSGGGRGRGGKGRRGDGRGWSSVCGRGQGSEGGNTQGQAGQDEANLTKAEDQNNNTGDNSIASESSGYSYYEAVVYFQQNNLDSHTLAMDSASSVNI
eukprot:12369605-Ditylum_brightwellii.AAC.1